MQHKAHNTKHTRLRTLTTHTAHNRKIDFGFGSCRACGRREHWSDNSFLPRLLFSTRLTEHAQNTGDHDTRGHTGDHTENHATGDHDTGNHMGDHKGNHTGTHTGDHTGNHTGDHTRDHDTGDHTRDHDTGDHDTGDHDTADHDTGDRGCILKSRQMHTGMNRRVRLVASSLAQRTRAACSCALQHHESKRRSLRHPHSCAL